MELTIVSPEWNVWPLVPFLGAAALFVLCLLLELFRPERSQPVMATWGPWGALALVAWCVVTPQSSKTVSMHGMMIDDLLSRGSAVLILLAVGLSLMTISREVRTSGYFSEYMALLLAAATGMILMATANHLMLIFLGLELFSLALYLLCIFMPERKACQESALKYFILSSLASAVILYGMALIYGATGTTWLSELRERVHSGGVLMLVGTAMVAAGLGFKVSAVPFHIWTPDVYQGAPSGVTGFMSVATKTAALVTLFRVFPLTVGVATDPGDRLRVQWMVFVWALSLMSMLAGNLMGLVQSDLKRLLAYSSIAQAGYLLTAVFVGSPNASQAMLFYLLAYSFANLAAFAVIVTLESDGAEVNLQTLRGMGGRHPVLAAVLALALFSLAGLPPTGGFVAKFHLFGALLRENISSLGRLLAVAGIMGSFIGAAYYLRCVAAMYSYSSEFQGQRDSATTGSLGAVMTICVLGILLTGVAAEPVFQWLAHFQPMSVPTDIPIPIIQEP